MDGLKAERVQGRKRFSGKVHGNYWRLVFRKSWLSYAQRHRHDVGVVSDFIDRTAGTGEAAIKLQKLHLLTLA